MRGAVSESPAQEDNGRQTHLVNYLFDWASSMVCATRNDQQRWWSHRSLSRGVCLWLLCNSCLSFSASPCPQSWLTTGIFLRSQYIDFLWVSYLWQESDLQRQLWVLWNRDNRPLVTTSPFLTHRLINHPVGSCWSCHRWWWCLVFVTTGPFHLFVLSLTSFPRETIDGPLLFTLLLSTTFHTFVISQPPLGLLCTWICVIRTNPHWTIFKNKRKKRLSLE